MKIVLNLLKLEVVISNKYNSLIKVKTGSSQSNYNVSIVNMTYIFVKYNILAKGHSGQPPKATSWLVI